VIGDYITGYHSISFRYIIGLSIDNYHTSGVTVGPFVTNAPTGLSLERPIKTTMMGICDRVWGLSD